MSERHSGGREITVRVVVLGVVLSVVMGAANVYVGLKVGMTVSASIPAAVLAMLLFRVLGRGSSIREANQVQTAASAGESLAAGIIFTMPALLFVGHWQSFDTLTVALVAFSGGALGILFMIPMRRVFVRDNVELPYPEGVACAAVLRAGESASEGGGGGEAEALLRGGLLGVLVKLAIDLFGVARGTIEGARISGGRAFYAGTDVLPLLVGVGYIVGLNVAFLLFLGGALSWLVGIPLLGGANAVQGEPVEVAWELWKSQVRYVGVGAMVVGGAASIVTVRKGLVAAIRELRAKRDASARRDETDRDLPGPLIGALAVVCALIVGIVYWQFTHQLSTTLIATAAMLVLSFFMTAVASYVVGLVGNSNSPVSGMTITAVLFTGGLLLLLGHQGEDLILATLGVAAVVCCVACTSGDVCNDLKTGLIVGATPAKQQGMQILGVAAASLVMAPVLQLLHTTTEGGIGGANLPAPQGQLFASLARGIAGHSDEIPWNMVALGAGLGVLVLLIDGLLARAGAKVRLHLMPIAVGAYLPFGIAPPILAGGLLAWFVARRARSNEEREARLHRGVLFSSGVIAGEALCAVAIAGVASIPAAAAWRKGLAEGTEESLGASGLTAGTLVLVAIVLAAFALAVRPSRDEKA